MATSPASQPVIDDPVDPLASDTPPEPIQQVVRAADVAYAAQREAASNLARGQLSEPPGPSAVKPPPSATAESDTVMTDVKQPSTPVPTATAAAQPATSMMSNPVTAVDIKLPPPLQQTLPFTAVPTIDISPAVTKPVSSSQDVTVVDIKLPAQTTTAASTTGTIITPSAFTQPVAQPAAGATDVKTDPPPTPPTPPTPPSTAPDVTMTSAVSPSEVTMVQPPAPAPPPPPPSTVPDVTMASTVSPPDVPMVQPPPSVPVTEYVEVPLGYDAPYVLEQPGYDTEYVHVPASEKTIPYPDKSDVIMEDVGYQPATYLSSDITDGRVTPLEVSDGVVNWRESCNTKLTTDADQQKFVKWFRNTGEWLNMPMDPMFETYDLHGYWLFARQPVISKLASINHLPDYCKKPNHMTFSTASEWHGKPDQHGHPMLGGRWYADKNLIWHYEPSTYVRSLHEPDDLINYFVKHEPYAFMDINGRLYGAGGLKVGKRPSYHKARQMLHDGTAHGQPLTDRQRRYFGAIVSHHEYKIPLKVSRGGAGAAGGAGGRGHGGLGYRSFYPYYPVYVPPLIGATALAYYASEMERARGTAEADYWRAQYERQLHAAPPAAPAAPATPAADTGEDADDE